MTTKYKIVKSEGCQSFGTTVNGQDIYGEYNPMTQEQINNSKTLAYNKTTMKPKYIEIDKYGNKFYYADKGMTKRHREDGPACEYAIGTKEWYLNGERHREDGPAVECTNGYKAWCLNGKRHREDGPAIEWADGHKVWYLNGKRHREDGPAIEYANGSKSWYVDGKPLTEEQFNSLKKPSCNGKVVEIDGKKYKLIEQ